MSRFLGEGHVAGIWNQPFFFLGCPGETLNHAQETVKFLFEHKYLIAWHVFDGTRSTDPSLPQEF
ncbi:MAG: hypothetical protein HY862_05615 [Chloroflexi bacterium]|nr:hypothetical protein [Chloroflexota bacterium]